MNHEYLRTSNLKFLLDSLIKNCETISQWSKLEKEFKRIKKTPDETFADFIISVLNKATYVNWGRKTKKDREMEKLKIIHEGCNDTQIQKVVEELQAVAETGVDVNYYKLIEVAERIDRHEAAGAGASTEIEGENISNLMWQ